MIYVYKLDPLNITIHTEDIAYMRQLREYFTAYTEGYMFTPKFKAGFWNGKICMVNAVKKSLPYGLLSDFVRFHKKCFPNIELTFDKGVSELFHGPALNIKYDLSLKPRDYQQECVEIMLKHSKGIVRAATASGKSLIIAYVIKNLIDNKITKRHLIIVPTIMLVTQFFNDLIDYGFDKKLLGKAWQKEKQFDKTIVISTWQTMSRNHGKLADYDCVVFDECHLNKAHEVKKIAEKCTNAVYRLGFTGTLNDVNKLDMWNVKSYIGPVLKDYSSGELADRGYISKCNIKVINLEYESEYEGDYNTVKDQIFINPFRLGVLENIVRKINGNVLLLVGKIEKEGKVLEEYFREKFAGTDREIVFIYGATPVEERESWRVECEKRKNIILIASYGVMQLGVNIPSLKYIVLASPFKSKIRTLQSIGRALRQHVEKTDGAYVYDIADECKYLHIHGVKRLRYYHSEKFNVEEQVIKEGEEIDLKIPGEMLSL
jgi:superfamily II DNA or RNA helicase